ASRARRPSPRRNPSWRRIASLRSARRAKSNLRPSDGPRRRADPPKRRPVSVSTGYSAREVAKLLGLPVSRVHSYVRSGFLKPARGPKRALAFSFQDVAVLRTASELVRSRIAPSRVRRILRQLANDLPEGRSLAGMTIVAEGNRVVVHSGGRR